MAKAKRPIYTTPKGEAVYPRLNQADTEYVPEGLYSVKLRVTEAEAKKFEEQYITEILDEAFNTAYNAAKPVHKKTLKKVAPVEPEVDKETGEPTGMWLIKCKAKASGTKKDTGEAWERKLDLRFKNGKKSDKVIYGGSIIQVGGSIGTTAIVNAKDQSVYATCYIDAVVVHEYSEGGSSYKKYGFDIDESADDQEDSGSGDGDDGEDIPF